MKVKSPDQMRRLRKEKHYTQRQLAYLVRRTQATIWQIEAGKLTNISEDLAVALSAYLGRTWEELFTAHESAVMPAVTNGQMPTDQLISA
ncbi:helix-turn-helix transcriptional regulator [Rhodococcus sp. SJ-2]